MNTTCRYIDAGWGWDEEGKAEELTCSAAQYLLVWDHNSQPIAFTHFRFDMDYGHHVLYWWVCGVVFWCVVCT